MIESGTVSTLSSNNDRLTDEPLLGRLIKITLDTGHSSIGMIGLRVCRGDKRSSMAPDRHFQTVYRQSWLPTSCQKPTIVSEEELANHQVWVEIDIFKTKVVSRELSRMTCCSEGMMLFLRGNCDLTLILKDTTRMIFALFFISRLISLVNPHPYN